MNTPEREEFERKPVIPSQHGAEELEESDLDLDEDDLDLDDDDEDDDEDVTEEEAERADGA
jgi:hypothetical protein